MERRLMYFHVGTGNTESVFYCPVCDGYYGVPHDGQTHDHTRKGHPDRTCACRPCQEHFGQYPLGGEFRWVDNAPSPRPLRAS